MDSANSKTVSGSMDINCRNILRRTARLNKLKDCYDTMTTAMEPLRLAMAVEQDKLDEARMFFVWI
jgi:hypothetical protein